MSGIYGELNLADNDRSFVNTLGQSLVFGAAQRVLARYNADLMAALRVFVAGETEEYKWRYKSPGGGRLPRRGVETAGPAVKATGEWDVAFPLEDFGVQVAGDFVALAYMRLDEFDNHLDSVMIRDINTVRFEMLKAIFNDTQDTFTDPIHGSLSIEPLANGDSVTYPPVLGSESEATDDHYLESGYAATAISDTNNPYITIRQELEEHFGASTGGDNIAVFIHPDEVPETEDLSDYDPVVDSFIRAGDNVSVPINLPAVPGRIMGRTNGCWIVEWRWMPSGYQLGIHLEEEPPLRMRVDPADTGLPRGLTLYSQEDKYPLEHSHYIHRFGFGAANRLNGVMMELGTGGTWTIPTGYS